MRLIWSPTRDLMQLRARLGEALGDPAVRRWSRTPRRPAAMPPLDFSETAEGYRIRVDLPGVKKEQVEVKVEEGTLEIAGEVPGFGSEETTARRLERFRGPFRRLVPLPRYADSEGITATLEAGVLTLDIPKAGPAAGRRIDIT